MKLRKAISLVAFGFLFIFVNFNLTVNGTSINIMPEFIGWILMFLAFTPLDTYMEGKRYMQWIPMILAVLTCVFWIISTFKPELESPTLSVVKSILNIVSAIYWFIMFTILEKVADDCGSTKGSTLRIIKIFSLVLYVIVSIIALCYQNMDIGLLATLFTVCGIGLLVLVVIALFVLFGLRKEINRSDIL